MLYEFRRKRRAYNPDSVPANLVADEPTETDNSENTKAALAGGFLGGFPLAAA